VAGKSDEELFRQTEFELRDITHQMGAKALEITANERIKRAHPTKAYFGTFLGEYRCLFSEWFTLLR
jgi:hypothetical protein